MVDRPPVLLHEATQYGRWERERERRGCDLDQNRLRSVSLLTSREPKKSIVTLIESRAVTDWLWMSGLHKLPMWWEWKTLFFCIPLTFFMSIQIYLFKNIPERIPKTFFSLSSVVRKKFPLAASRNTFIICTATTVSCSSRPLAMKIPWEACSAVCDLLRCENFISSMKSSLVPSPSCSRARFFWGITPTMNFLEALNWEKC